MVDMNIAIPSFCFQTKTQCWMHWLKKMLVVTLRPAALVGVVVCPQSLPLISFPQEQCLLGFWREASTAWMKCPEWWRGVGSASSK
jgi:hypothetical protein